MKVKSLVTNFWVESTLNSYSIILFSNNKILAAILMLVSFLTPEIGAIGLAFLLVFHFLLVRLGYDKTQIRSGLLGFNSVLVGLSIAYSYQLNSYFIGLFFIAILISVVVVVWCKNYFDKYKLPFLTIPFFIIINIISVATKSFDVFNVNMNYVFHDNTLVTLQQSSWYQLGHSLDNLVMPNHFKVFLITLSTVFFQKSVLGGLLILLGLFIYSRIAVVYAFIGFYSALLFYHIMGGNIDNLTYFYSGINFIFLAIALGCFFYIPNVYSMLLVFLLSPILMFIMISLNKIMVVFQMNSLSMSFSVLTSITLYILYTRHTYKLIIPANTSYYSPEKSRYEYLHQLTRKIANPHYSMVLPFWGEWFVSQGYEGKITHLGDWSKALDFVIVDELKKTYQNLGQRLEHFYCYNKPVLAPADGYIYDITSHIEENEVNDVNVEQNWGNTIVMNHLNGLYTQLSHLKKESFLVNIGDYVTQGTVIASCGNSGRSPEPHIHFQVQHYPTIGAKTVPLPFSYFIENNNGKLSLKINEIPEENSCISNVEQLHLLWKTFHFSPNQRLKVYNEKTQIYQLFEIYTNEFNELYLHCGQTDSKLFFKNDGVLFSVEKYEGSTKSILFELYCSCYSILLAYYPTISLDRYMPNYHFTRFGLQIINDIFAPIYNFISLKYQSKAIKIDNLIAPNEVILETQHHTEILGIAFSKRRFTIHVFDDMSFRVHNHSTNNKLIFSCETY